MWELVIVNECISIISFLFILKEYDRKVGLVVRKRKKGNQIPKKIIEGERQITIDSYMETLTKISPVFSDMFVVVS